MSVRIYTSRNILNWPQGTNMSNSDIIGLLHATAVDDHNNDLTNRIIVTGNNVNSQKLGQYSLDLSVTNDDGETDHKKIEVDVIPNHGNTPQKRRRLKHWRIIFVLLLLLILGISLKACSDRHQEQQANNAEQSSQIADNSSAISNLATKNSQLQQEEKKLNRVINQYQNDHDQNELNSQLAGIRQDIDSIKSTTNLNSNDSDYAQQLTNAANQVQQSPSQARQIISNLTGNDNAIQSKWNQFVSWLQSQY